MSVQVVHDFLESNCPDGAGFAIQSEVLSDLIRGIISKLAAGAPANTDIAMDQSPTVRFSFMLDAGTFSLNADFDLSMQVHVWLHPRGNPNSPIVSLIYDISKAHLEPIYDATIQEFRWTSYSSASVTLVHESPLDDQALIDAGYATQDQSDNIVADKQRFLQELFYGFKWLNARNLLPGLILNIPFPQIQHWLLPVALQFPFSHAFQGGYIVIWTDVIRNVFHDCGGSENEVGDPPERDWQLRGSVPVPASPFDDAFPTVLLYVAAKNLISWEAKQVAPAVMLSKSGGGFIRWSYDAAVSVQKVRLELVPSPTGGALELYMGLRAIGMASAWIDGPSGARLSLANASLTANGDVTARAAVEYNEKAARIELDASVQARIDQSSIDINSGGLLGSAIGEIVEMLIRSGAIKLKTSYYSRIHMPLVDLSDLLIYRARAQQRVGSRSMLVFYFEDKG
ncbi:hypothetical protein [Mesorhizobium sp. M0041]|uniref:hypothetical protein n=1 Tax=Mesorhizobium sp. M0041 TaxID=2956856 RepID=UPI00333523E5